MIIQEIADGQKEFWREVSDQQVEFCGLSGYIPEEEFLLHLKKTIRQAGLESRLVASCVLLTSCVKNLVHSEGHQCWGYKTELDFYLFIW